MLKRMHLKNLTVFSDVNLNFSKSLNVFVGENGAGKTHLLKMAYAVLAVCSEETRQSGSAAPTKTNLQGRIADKLVNVFRSESLGRLARRKPGRERCDVQIIFTDRDLNIDFSFATNSKTEVTISKLPKRWIDIPPVYIPTRELLSIFPNFISVYEGHYLEFEETWRDTCLLLGAPVPRGPRSARIKELVGSLEQAMQGTIEFDRNNGRFYLKTNVGSLEIPLVAEGYRKLAMLARLISAGSLVENSYLFWDEPESNLNPRLIKEIANFIFSLSTAGVQVFIATHSLFLLKEMEIILSKKANKSHQIQFFGLQSSDSGFRVMQGTSLDDIGDIVSLDEELLQSDRFLGSDNDND